MKSAHHKRKGVVANAELGPIPEKKYFTISETAQLCGVKPYVLRFWEQEFNQLKPEKRRGNRRYYQHSDLLLIRNIRSLLYQQGFTIEGAIIQLQTNANIKNNEVQLDTNSTPNIMSTIVAELNEVLALLQNDHGA